MIITTKFDPLVVKSSVTMDSSTRHPKCTRGVSSSFCSNPRTESNVLKTTCKEEKARARVLLQWQIVIQTWNSFPGLIAVDTQAFYLYIVHVCTCSSKNPPNKIYLICKEPKLVSCFHGWMLALLEIHISQCNIWFNNTMEAWAPFHSWYYLLCKT
jgi:hypothetical protein